MRETAPERGDEARGCATRCGTPCEARFFNRPVSALTDRGRFGA